jgi:transcriptional regulator with XRE-family HTH domain
MESKQSFGQWVRQRRKELDLTQQQLADQVGCPIETISMIEAGQNRPSHLLAERLARFLELTYDSDQDLWLIRAISESLDIASRGAVRWTI